MKFEETNEGDTVILKLQGKLLLGETEELGKKVDELVAAGKNRISLDMSGVPYMDSAGLGQITRCYTTVRRHDGKLVLVNIPKKIRELLSVTRLLDILEGKSA